MAFPVRSATEATIRHLENASVATTKKKPRQDTSKGKVKLQLFFIKMELFTWNSSLEILDPLRDTLVFRRKSPELWQKNCLLLHDNTAAHRPVLVQEELVRQQVTVSQTPSVLT